MVLVTGVANFEMIGYYTEQPNSQQIPFGFDLLFPNEYAAVIADSSRGNFIINTGDTESSPFNAAYDSLAQIHVPVLKMISILLPNNGTIAPDFRRSDHANFWDINVPALMITDGANFRNTNYHTPTDVLDNLNFTFMSNVVKATVATIATLAGLQHSSYKDYGRISSIPESNYSCDVIAFPNPLKNKLKLKTGDCFEKGYTLSIVDVQGKLVRKEKVETNTQTEISLENLPSGNYFIVMEEGGKRNVKKIAVK